MAVDLLVVAHSYALSYNRVLMELDVAADAGLQAEVICLRDEGEPPLGEYRGARIRRLPVRRHRGASLLVYMAEYLAFFVGAFLLTSWIAIRHRPRFVIVHSLPDTLVFCAIVPKLLGSRIVANLREFTPELIQTRYDAGPDHPLVRIGRWLEQASCAFADQVITVHDPGVELLASRGVARRKLVPIVNTIERDLGVRARSRDPKRPFTLLFHGTAGYEYDLITVVRALAILRDRGVPDGAVLLRVVADGASIPSVKAEAERLELQGWTRFEPRIPYAEVPSLLAIADVGVPLLTETPYAHLGLPTKLLEAIGVGLPVIATPGRIIQEYFPAGAIRYVPFANPEAVANAISDLRGSESMRARMAATARMHLQPLLPEEMERRYERVFGLNGDRPERHAPRAEGIGSLARAAM